MLTRNQRFIIIIAILAMPVLIKGIVWYCGDYVRPFCCYVVSICHFFWRAWGRLLSFGENNPHCLFCLVGALTIVLVTKIALRCAVYKQSQPTSQDTAVFLSDEPVLSLDGDSGDKLDRRAYVDGIVKLIKNGPCDKRAMFIAVYGAWGDGKTSVRNMAEEILNNDEANISFVDFSPWKYSSNSDLQSVYFDVLAGHLSKRGESITAKACRRFSWALAARNLNKNVGSIHWLVDIARGTLFDVAQTEMDLNSALRKIIVESGRRIVVVIDDLERLPEDQVCEVIRFLKANADLPGIIYLVLSDEEYLAGAAASIMPSALGCDVSCGREFLEKIFTFRMDIPPINERRLLRLLKDYIADVLAKNHLDKMDEFDADYELGAYVENMRRLKRIVNSFIVDIEVAKSSLSGHMYLNRHIGDMLALVVLRLKLPDAYNRLRTLYWKVVNAYSPFEEMSGVDESCVRGLFPKLGPDDWVFLNRFMEHRLGVMYNGAKKVYCANHPDVPEKVIKYRLASSLVFDEYFLIAQDERVLSEDDKSAFLKAIEIGEYPKSLLMRLDNECALPKLLYALEAQTVHSDEKMINYYLYTLVRLSSERLTNSQLSARYAPSSLTGRTSVYMRIFRCLLFYLQNLQGMMNSGMIINRVQNGHVGDALMTVLRDVPDDVFILARLVEYDAENHKAAGSSEYAMFFSGSAYNEVIDLFLDRVPGFTSSGLLMSHPEFFTIFRAWLILLKAKNDHKLYKRFREACLPLLKNVADVRKIIIFFSIDNRLSCSISDRLQVEADVEKIELFFGTQAAKQIKDTLGLAGKIDLYTFHFYISLKWALAQKKKRMPYSIEDQKNYLIKYITTKEYLEQRRNRVDEALGLAV